MLVAGYCGRVHSAPDPNTSGLARTMSKLPASKNRLLPGWARVVLMVLGIAMLLMLLQQVSLAIFAGLLG